MVSTIKHENWFSVSLCPQEWEQNGLTVTKVMTVLCFTHLETQLLNLFFLKRSHSSCHQRCNDVCRLLMSYFHGLKLYTRSNFLFYILLYSSVCDSDNECVSHDSLSIGVHGCVVKGMSLLMWQWTFVFRTVQEVQCQGYSTFSVRYTVRHIVTVDNELSTDDTVKLKTATSYRNSFRYDGITEEIVNTSDSWTLLHVVLTALTREMEVEPESVVQTTSTETAEEMRQQPATQSSSTDTAEELRPASAAEKTSTHDVRKPHTRDSSSTDTAEDVRPLKARLRQHVPPVRFRLICRFAVVIFKNVLMRLSNTFHSTLKLHSSLN